MSEITRLRSNEKLSRIVKYNGMVWLCGQVPTDTSGDIEDQTRSCLARIDEHLAEAGTDKSKMLYCSVYIKDITLAPRMNAIWNDWLKDCVPPARCCVQADMARPEILVEISVQAAA
jgi:enamine deaminase RidA (YjgF/YER057c/UK114 family)